MKKLLNIIFLFLITVSFYGQTIPSYYNGLDVTKTGNDLFLELSGEIISTHSGIPYTGSTTDVWDACKLADEDPENAANVLLIYGFNDNDGLLDTDRTRDKTLQDTGSGASGVWNREHVFAKSLANPNLVAESNLISPGSDVHNLRPADRDRNSERSNNKFTDGTGNSGIISTNGGWYPGDEWKGDVARIVMYMYLRYHGNGTQSSETSCLPINVGFGTVNDLDPNMIDLFLQWNVEDPVSPFEANRNEVLSGIQMNRNPFIDNPYLATVIWGGLAAEDKWWSNNSSDTEIPSTPLNLVASNITDDSFDVIWDASTDNESVYDYLVYLDDVYLQSTSLTSTTITNLNPSTNYNITIKARDVSSNLSETSDVLNVMTLEGPKILLAEDFEDCANVSFFLYSEASNKDWACETQFGENNSGSYGINGYQEDVASKDWLITNSPINFDVETGEKLSFYTDAAYGTSPLDLVYSLDYDGVGNPSSFTWTSVPNVPTLIHNNTSTEIIYAFTDVDISAITGTVYFAFKYYSNGVPTRWTVDSFEITADNDNPDSDGDGVLNNVDLCSNTPIGDVVDANGCSNGQLDDDNDGIQNSLDLCESTPAGEDVNADGCGASQLDDDNDGIFNDVDICANTPTGELADVNGCSDGQRDDDNDGVQNSLDVCESTPAGEDVNADGCGASQLDDDNDGIFNDVDICANTPTGEVADVNGCSDGQRDDDNDGVQNSLDVCESTPAGEDVNADGCGESQLDDDNDGIYNDVDICANTPTGEIVDVNGCSDSQLDDDTDGVMNDKDLCNNTAIGTLVDATGCFTLLSDNFEIIVTSETCPDEDNGELLIVANETHNYIAVISGVPADGITPINIPNSDFTTSLSPINNLTPGIYTICIIVDGEDFKQCFIVEVKQSDAIEGKSSIVSGKASVEIETGTSPFTVFVNGDESFKTNSPIFNVDVKHGDVIEVKTSVSCEGVYSKTVELLDGIVAYPNPSNGTLEISLPVSQKEVTIELYTIQSQLISVKTYPVLYGKVQLNIENQPAGMYIVKIQLDSPVTLKIIKQ